jgi:hypothetical protein
MRTQPVEQILPALTRDLVRDFVVIVRIQRKTLIGRGRPQTMALATVAKPTRAQPVEQILPALTRDLVMIPHVQGKALARNPGGPAVKPMGLMEQAAARLYVVSDRKKQICTMIAAPSVAGYLLQTNYSKGKNLHRVTKKSQTSRRLMPQTQNLWHRAGV